MCKNIKFRRIISFVIFICILFQTVIGITYLFREPHYDRQHVMGIENETSPIDMVYIGGSAAFVYWQPLKAWNDCGFTSYNYATNTIQAETIKYYIKEVRKSQDPELYVIGIRSFEYWTEEIDEVGIRSSTDVMNILSKNRTNQIKDYLAIRESEEKVDTVSYYFDIAKYHTNYSSLANKWSWVFAEKNLSSINKGWEWIPQYAYLPDNLEESFQTQERYDVPQGSIDVLKDLLSYCKDENLNVLFVVCPYAITEEEYGRFNTIGDVIKEYGYDYLNANDFYKEMGLDFTTDFYNKNHVNAYGAEKYTEFLEDYIVANYEMPNHKGKTEYANWDVSYNRFKEEEINCKQQISIVMQDVNKGSLLAEKMQDTTDLAEWYKIVQDNRYTILMIQKGQLYEIHNYAEDKIIRELGYTQDSIKKIGVLDYNDGTRNNSSENGIAVSGVLGPWSDTNYYIQYNENDVSILVNDEEWAKNEEGINVVVFDNNYRKVVDSLVIQLNGNEASIIR